MRRLLDSVTIVLVVLLAAEAAIDVGVLARCSAFAVCVALIAYARRVNRAAVADEEDRRTEAEMCIALAGAVLIRVDADCVITMANRHACEVFGRDERALLGRTFQDLLAPEEDRSKSAEAFAAILAGRIDPGGYRSRRRIARPDGAVRHVEWEIAAQEDASGRIHALIASGADVTAAVEREDDLTREIGDLERLRELARAVAGRADARQDVVDGCLPLLDARSVSLAEPDPGSPGGWLVTHSTNAPDVGTEPIEPGPDDPALACAVNVDGKRRALLLLEWDAHESLTRRTRHLAGLAVDKMAMALRAVDDRRQLTRAALTDPLTGIANRRAFDDELKKAVAHHEVSGQPLSVILADLNAFKALNDSVGHEAGDRLLVSCARHWSDALRAEDLIARLGGDEFAVLLPGADAAIAARVADRLRLATTHGPGVSIGIATADAGDAADPESLVARADHAMYADKRQRSQSRLASMPRLKAVELADRGRSESAAGLDAIVRRAQGVVGAPGVYVTLVGDTRVTYAAKANDADQDSGRPVAESYCHRLVATGRPLVIPDAGKDHVVNGSRAHRGGLTAYAGVPLTDRDGQVLGAVCAIDSRPREWTSGDLIALHQAARDASTLLRAGDREGR